jgi:ATP-dependent DNA helicase RecG
VLRGAGPSIIGHLERIGILSVGDLLLHFPREYEDRTQLIPFSQFAEGRTIFTKAKVVGHEWFGFGRMRSLKILVQDESSEAALLCYNRPFLEKSLPVGSTILVHGKFQFRYGEIQSSNFEAERIGETQTVETALLPIYPLTAGLSQKILRKLVHTALAMYGSRVENELAQDLIRKYGLIEKSAAIGSIHFPASQDMAEKARKTLAYEELFHFQLNMARRINARRTTTIERKRTPGLLERRLLERLPFELTADQRRTLDEIVSDMNESHPMGRLLQGDVGSGKTIVALLAALHAVERGGQAALMAPTELLARQHAATAANLLEPLGVRLAFLTGNLADAARPPLLKALADGEIDVVLGTHALFSKDVRYHSLDLVVIDEQQRFGVLQRMALFRKGRIPDTLMMTATPIPRSLALTLFGDLAVSTIRTMPPNRKPVITHLAKSRNVARVYEFIRGLLREGRQAFFVYPMIEDSDSVALKNAEQMAVHLSKKVYPEFTVALLHSRLKEQEKNRVMDDFVSGKTNILVSTTVVEVGVDIPNAVAMIVEHAERFGLSALHQLRGRVGRGKEQGYCFLVYSDDVGEDAVQRLKALYKTTDGFELAEEDLKIRGPGELGGTAQSGSLRLTIADPIRDFDLLKAARADAFSIIRDDPALLKPENQVYRNVLKRSVSAEGPVSVPVSESEPSVDF